MVICPDRRDVEHARVLLPDARNISAINDFPFCTLFFGSSKAQQDGRTRTFSYSVAQHCDVGNINDCCLP